MNIKKATTSNLHLNQSDLSNFCSLFDTALRRNCYCFLGEQVSLSKYHYFSKASMTVLTKFLFDSAEKSSNKDVHFACHSFGCWWNYSLNRCVNKALK